MTKSARDMSCDFGHLANSAVCAALAEMQSCFQTYGVERANRANLWVDDTIKAILTKPKYGAV